MTNTCFSLTPSILLKIQTPPLFRARLMPVSARLHDNKANRQLNLSVLRFTLGIPGLDESYLPRWIGYGFGSLLILNHFFGSNSLSLVTSAQLRTEVLGLSLAAFSISLPYLGKFLKGATPMDQTTIPDGSEQIFVMSQKLSNTQKEDLAWASYILLRNTNAISVLISVGGELCTRGYWNTPTDLPKSNMLEWFSVKIEEIGLSDVKSTLYFTQVSDFGLWEMLPKGTRSVLVQPLTQVEESSDKMKDTNEGFILLASTISYAFSEKDRAWIGALANKFRGMIVDANL